MKSIDVQYVADIKDEQTQTVKVRLKFRNSSGSNEQLELPRGELAEPRRVYAALLNRGARLPVETKPPMELVELLKTQPKKRYVRAAHTGWRSSFEEFVTPTRVINNKLVLPPEFTDQSILRTFDYGGGLDGWKREVASQLSYSSIGMVAMAAACAAPLLRLCGWPTFGINIFGPSKIGKTSLACAALSFSGSGSPECVPNWASTSAGLIELATAFNDILYPVDEPGLIAGGPKDVRDHLRQQTYALSSGRERKRHSGSGYAALNPKDFRMIALSLSEHPLDHFAHVAGSKREGGEVARFIDLPASQAGSVKIFDRCPEEMSPEQMNSWADIKLRRIYRGCEEHHGVALPRLVKYVITDPRRAKEKMEKYDAIFLRREGSVGTTRSPAEDHQIRCIAKAFAGGCVGIDAGVLPYKKEELCRAFLKVMSAYAPKHGTGDREVLNVRVRGLPFLSQVDGIESDRCDGYIDDRRHPHTAVVRAASFYKWFGGVRDRRRAILEWLEQTGRLLVRHSRLADRVAERREERTLKWPDGSIVRSIQFLHEQEHGGTARGLGNDVVTRTCGR